MVKEVLYKFVMNLSCQQGTTEKSHGGHQILCKICFFYEIVQKMLQVGGTHWLTLFVLKHELDFDRLTVD